MSDRKLAFASAVTMTLTQANLGVNGWRESTAVDNTTNKYLDALVGGKTQVGAVSANGTIEVYAYASYDGTVYTAGLDGADATITWGSSPAGTGVLSYNDLVFLGKCAVEGTDDNKDMVWGPFSVASAFGGVLPPKWGIVLRNNTNIATNATGTNDIAKYTGVYETIL